jgi:hypothetical protein
MEGDDFLRRPARDLEPAEGDPCARVYEEGYPIPEQFGLTGYDIYYPCKVDMHGAPPGSFAVLPPADPNVFLGFVGQIPLLSRDDMLGAPDGVYTWLVFSNGDNNKAFVASKSLDALEIGVKHGVIATRVNAARIHSGGEIEKKGAVMRFNLQSGTYLKHWFQTRANKKKGRCDHYELNDYLKERFKELFPGAVYQDNPFEMKRLTDQDRAMYIAHGFRIVDVSDLSYFDCIGRIEEKLKGGRRTRRRIRKRRYTRRR